MSASPAGLRTASNLLRALSRQLAPDAGQFDEEEENEVDDEFGDNGATSPVRRPVPYQSHRLVFGQDGYEEDENAVDIERESKLMETATTVKPVQQKQSRLEDFARLADDLRFELTEQRRRFDSRIAELEEENRRLVAVARRAKERTREIEEVALKQLGQERAWFENELFEVEARFEDERKRHLREIYDLETIHKDQLASLSSSYEAWANQVEADQNERMRLAEHERHLALDRVAELEEIVRGMEMEKARQAEEYERRLLEEQVAKQEVQLDYENKVRAFKEAQHAQSRRRVSQALDALVL